MKKQFRRLKAIFKNDEEKALADVCNKEGFTPEELRPEHEGITYVWRVLAFKKNKAEATEVEAIQMAMDFFGTYESNLESKHTEDQYVFTQIRG